MLDIMNPAIINDMHVIKRVIAIHVDRYRSLAPINVTPQGVANK